MPVASLRGLFHVGTNVLNTAVDAVTGTILAFLGDVVQAEAGGPGAADGDGAEWWQQVGFLSRPPKPVAGKAAAEAVVIRQGGVDVCIASRDVRGQELAGNLGYGEACVYAPGENATAQGRVILKGNGTVTLFTTDDNTKDGDSVYFRVAPNGFHFVAPWGTLRFDETGFHVLHESGAAFDLGGISGLPAPVDMLASYAKITAATIAGTATAPTFGAGPAKPLASAPDVAAAISALQAQIGSLMTAIGAITAGATNGGAAALAPVAPDLAANAATVAASIATIPSATSSA